MTAAPPPLEDRMSPEQWEACLGDTFRIVSGTTACKPVLRDIGPIRLQLLVTDRPEMSYWEEYCGERIVPHLGVCEDCTVVISTTFPVLVGTLLNRISVMEAAADEAYELRGDTTTLMKCANILPFVASAFAEVFPGRAASSMEGVG
jgi:hypothetical protein